MADIPRASVRNALIKLREQRETEDARAAKLAQSAGEWAKNGMLDIAHSEIERSAIAAAKASMLRYSLMVLYEELGDDIVRSIMDELTPDVPRR